MHRFLFLLTFLTGITLFAQSTQVDTEDKHLKGLDKELEALLEDFHVAGFGVAVVEGDEVLYAKGIGYRDYENKVPADAQTLFAIGSCTKAFTASLLGQLREQEKVDFDESPITYLPELRFHNDEMNQLITVQDLMCHRTGLPRHDGSWYLFPTDSEEELVARIAHQEPTAAVRSRWQYNNFMFMLQGKIAGDLYGQPWKQAVRTYLLDPLGMTQTTVSIPELLEVENRAIGYVVADDQIEQTDYYRIRGMGAAGSINSSALEMANWVRVWIGDGTWGDKEILPARYKREAITSQMAITAGLPGSDHPDIHLATYGYGWGMGSYRGHYRVEHGGAIDGFTASTCFFPSDSFGIVVLVNQGGSALPPVVRNMIADRMLGLEREDWAAEALDASEGDEEEAEEEEKTVKEEGVPSAHALTDFEGSFMNPGYGSLRVFIQDDSLFAAAPDDTLWLMHMTFDAFAPLARDDMGEEAQEAAGQFVFNFQTDNRGNISGVTLPIEPSLENPILFKRQIEEKSISQDALQTYVGDYEINGVEIAVYIRNETLYTEVPGQPPYALIPTGEHAFAFRDLEGYSVRFIPDDEGTTDAVEFTQPNGVFKAMRKEE